MEKEDFEFHPYWVEGSGAIEHFFKKQNAYYPIPNTMASEILGVPADRIRACSGDKVHYERMIGSDSDPDWRVKMMIGVQDEATFNRVVEMADNYEGFRKEMNKVEEGVSNRYTIKQAIYIIENIYRAHEEDGFNELIPSWHQGLVDSLASLRQSGQTTKTVMNYIKYGEYLLADMQLLELHPLELKDFAPKSKQVSSNPSHENNIDTSVGNNPAEDDSIVPNVAVWSVPKRQGENVGEEIERQINAVTEKFVSLYPVGITILVPGRSHVNEYIVSVIMSRCGDVEVIEGVIRKITTEEVDDMVLYDDDCKFRQSYRGEFNAAYYELHDYLKMMNAERDGYFSRRLVKNARMRDVLDRTLKASGEHSARFANKINGRHILVIDDTISRGQTIKEVCSIIGESYAPQSITVLHL